MQKEFWQNKWDTMELGFHLSSVNPLLVQHVEELKLIHGDRIVIPLCGKSLDIAWLLSQGFSVVGVEMIEHAVVQLFEELGVAPQIDRTGKLKRYSADKLIIFVGDIFDLSAQLLGNVDAVYDRAALVALPSDIRKKYMKHLVDISQNARQLLVSFVYDQNIMSGPPFSVNDQEIENHYAEFYELNLLYAETVKEPVKGNDQIQEKVWLLKQKGSES